MKRARVMEVFLVAAILTLVVAGLFTSSLIRERQQALKNVLGYNIAFDANQTAIEFLRLQNALQAFEATQNRNNLDDARLRFEIFVSRVEAFRTGDLRQFIEADDQRSSLFQALRDVLSSLDSIIPSAGFNQQVQLARALLAPFELQLIGFASQANRNMAAQAAANYGELVKLHWRFSSLTFGLIVAGLLLLALLSWNNRLLSRAHKELTQKEDALRGQNRLFNAALNNMSQGLCMFDDALRPIVFNTQFEKLFDVGLSTISNRIGDVQSRFSLRVIMPDIAATIEQNLVRNRQAGFETECRDGRIIAVTQQPMAAGDWVATFEDVTEQRRVQAQIKHMASHDGLTNLPNRYLFSERMHEMIGSSRASGTLLAVMCLDLDHFKEINDTLGHPTGDALLCAAAKRLVSCVGESDMVARIGGDEFAVLQPSLESSEGAGRLAARIVEAMHSPFMINGETMFVTASVGIALAPSHGDAADTLLRNADLALYAAKSGGRQTFRFFEKAMGERLTRRLEMERDLRQAIENQEFRLDYQPIVELRTRQIIGFEALLRWTHPVWGVIPPSEFIPIAEDTGLIKALGRWVLHRACADAAEWPSDVKVSVNLSTAQFVNSEIADDVTSALGQSSLSPSRLVVEITESLLLGDKEGALGALRALKSLGLKIAMDDFGTGYSSLSYLQKYPFDTIKIDRAFVNTAHHGEHKAAIVKTIVQLGAALGMNIVAEGIETDQDLEMLLTAGCTEGQGYLISPPVPLGKVADLISACGCRSPKGRLYVVSGGPS